MHKGLIIFLIIVKIVATFYVSGGLAWNTDEESNYEIASNYLQGKGFTLYDKDTKNYKLSATHSSFTVFIYILMQKFNLPREIWPLFIHLFTILLYGISLVYFFKIADLFIRDKKMVNLAMVAYGLYPSVIYYIGSLFFFENIVVSLLIILLYKIIVFFCFNQKIKIKDYILIPLIVAFSCLSRPNSILIFILLFLTLIVFLIRDYFEIKLIEMRKILLILLVCLFTLICHIPALIKNYNMFGHYIINTQSGLCMFFGHNPYARGSWDGNSLNKDNKIYKYIQDNVPDFEGMDQLQQSEATKKLAIRWILDNPTKEIMLIFRKLLIYFLPQNYTALPGNRLWNPINLTFNLLFLLYLFRLVFKKEFLSRPGTLVFVPIFASLLTCLIFFVCYRIRYYAEPFMILAAFIFLKNALPLKLSK